MQGAVLFRERKIPPWFLRKSDAMFSGYSPSPSDDLGKKLIQSRVGPSVDLRVLVFANHDIHVDIAISGMSEARNGKSTAHLKPVGKLDEVDEFGDR